MGYDKKVRFPSLPDIRKTLVVVLGNGTLITCVATIPGGVARELVIVLTAVATALGVYIVPNDVTGKHNV